MYHLVNIILGLGFGQGIFYQTVKNNHGLYSMDSVYFTYKYKCNCDKGA